MKKQQRILKPYSMSVVVILTGLKTGAHPVSILNMISFVSLNKGGKNEKNY